MSEITRRDRYNPISGTGRIEHISHPWCSILFRDSTRRSRLRLHDWLPDVCTFGARKQTAVESRVSDTARASVRDGWVLFRCQAGRLTL